MKQVTSYTEYIIATEKTDAIKILVFWKSKKVKVYDRNDELILDK